jgi:hypothetical protein
MAIELFAQYLRPARGVAEYAGDFQQLRAGRENLTAQRQQNQLNAMALQERTRASGDAAEDRNTLQRIASSWTPETTVQERIGQLRLSGRPNLMAQADALEKTSLDADKTRAETKAKEAETLTKNLNVLKFYAGGVMANPTRENAVMALDAYEQLTGRDASAERQAIMAFTTPDQIKQWAASRALEADKLMPTIQQRDTGQVSEVLAVDPVSGAVRVTNQARNTVSPNAQLQANVGMAQAGAQREVAQATRDAASIRARAEDETGIRKEFNSLPEVTKYKAAIPAHRAVVEAAKSNNAQADINLIYGLAKLYDPESVVREGEYATIANSQSIPEWLKGWAQRIAGGGKLTTETKKQIVQQANQRLDTFKAAYDTADQGYRGVVTRRGLKPENVLIPVGGVAGQSQVIDFGDLK